MLTVTSLGSGSAGNSLLIESKNAKVLVDVGLSALQIYRRLEEIGISFEQLDGILISHEHMDHTRGLDVLCRRYFKDKKVRVFCTTMTQECLQGQRCNDNIHWQIIAAGEPFSLEDMQWKAFPIPHDAVDPMGFRVEAEGFSVGIASDLGYVPQSLHHELKDLHGLYLEANYDEELLQQDTKRPWATKQRIASKHGHLSNEQMAEFLEEIATPSLQWTMLGHLSKDCNSPALARKYAKQALEKKSLHQTQIHISEQKSPTAPCRLSKQKHPALATIA